MKKILLAGLISGILVFSINPSYAVPFVFQACTANNPVDVLAGQIQLGVDVTDPGGSQVLFTFTNVGASASSITDIYFDDGSLLGIASITNGAGVDFSQDASPGNLPGAGDCPGPDFETTAGFSADSNPPAQPNGVNPGETVAILFNLQGGATFADVISELNSGELRIGVHVQGFSSGGSESFINTLDGLPPTEILVGGATLPIDSTLLLLAGVQSTTWMVPMVISLIGIGLVLAKRK